MKILYVANVRMPTEKAHGLQIAKTCEAFAESGALEALWIPDRDPLIATPVEDYFGLNQKLPLRRLWTIDAVPLGYLGFLLQTATFTVAVILALCRSQGRRILYSRDEGVLWASALFTRDPIVWETHVGSWNFFARRVAARAFRIIAISQGLKEFYVAHGVPEGIIIIAPDGITLEDFARPEPKAKARTRLGLPQDARLALYIGRLDGWKGVRTLCEAPTYLSPKTLVVVIGGEESQVRTLSREYPQIRFLGPRPYRELADNQAAADVLVLPNTGKEEVSARFTSPLKLFTYMASGIPIVTSDLPSIREVLDDDACYFVQPDDPAALAQGVEKALDDSSSHLRAARARAKVEAYTWQRRAAAILAAL